MCKYGGHLGSTRTHFLVGVLKWHLWQLTPAPRERTAESGAGRRCHLHSLSSVAFYLFSVLSRLFCFFLRYLLSFDISSRWSFYPSSELPTNVAINQPTIPPSLSSAYTSIHLPCDQPTYWTICMPTDQPPPFLFLPSDWPTYYHNLQSCLPTYLLSYHIPPTTLYLTPTTFQIIYSAVCLPIHPPYL